MGGKKKRTNVQNGQPEKKGTEQKATTRVTQHEQTVGRCVRWNKSRQKENSTGPATGRGKMQDRATAPAVMEPFIWRSSGLAPSGGGRWLHEGGGGPWFKKKKKMARPAEAERGTRTL